MTRNRLRRGLARATVIFLIAFAAPAIAEHRIHYSLLDEPPRGLPKKLVAIPADVTIREVSAGGVPELVPQWAELASANFTRAMREIAASRTDLNLAAPPELSEEEKALLEQYLATYLVVSSTAHNLTAIADPAWEHKRKRFDYTLGTGLAFLRERSGAEAAILIVGDDVVSTQERKALAVVGILLGVAVPLGRSIVAVGVVDLASGDILWMNHSVSVRYDLKDYDSAKAMLAEIFAEYPGLPGKRP